MLRCRPAGAASYVRAEERDIGESNGRAPIIFISFSGSAAAGLANRRPGATADAQDAQGDDEERLGIRRSDQGGVSLFAWFGAGGSWPRSADLFVRRSGPLDAQVR